MTVNIKDGEYRPAPFWFLNHRLEKSEIARQLRQMKECGVGGFFMHPRAGLKTPYMSAEWMEMVRFAVDEAEKLGLQAWLYDEDPFPSGAAGGRVFFDHPEFAAREIRFFELAPDCSGRLEADLGRGTVLTAVAFRSENGKTVEELDVRDRIGVIRSDFFKAPWFNSYYNQLTGIVKYPHFRSETFYPHLQIALELPAGEWTVLVTTAEVIPGTEKYMANPDNLNPECVRYFLEHTHEKYREAFGDKFGTVIPGIFTDEPSVGCSMPWTAGLEPAFEKAHGYPIRGKYHHLFRNIDDSSRTLRKHFWETVYALFDENFFGQIQKWCERNSLELCGHGIGEEDPLATSGGSNTFGLQKRFAIPGFDHITHNVPDGVFTSLNLGGKMVGSAALQQGKRRVLSECFGCNPFNFNTDGMRKVANWLYSLGVNWLVPHGFFYSYDGHRKFDAGKSFFFQDQDFSNFRRFAGYAERTGEKLGRADSMNHVCVLFPVSVFRSLFPGEMKRAEGLRSDLFRLVQNLIECHIQFDLADEETLLGAEHGKGFLRCGFQKYDTVVTLHFDGIETADVKEVLRRCSGTVPVKYSDEIESLPPFAGEIRITPAERSLMGTLKKTDAGILLFLFNNSASPRKFSMAATRRREACYCFDAETGAYSLIPEKDGLYSFAVGGFDAVILECRTAFTEEVPFYRMPENLPVKTFGFEKNPEWDYLPPGENWAAAIHRWDIRLTGKDGAEQVETDHPFCLIRELTGTEVPLGKKIRPRPIFDTVPEVPSQYPQRMECTAEFTLPEEALAGPLHLVLESETFAGESRLFLNGSEIVSDLLKRARIYDPWNLAADVRTLCRSGRNTLRVVWENANEPDGLRSSLYIFTGNLPEE